jgi:hypothetical protein
MFINIRPYINTGKNKLLPDREIIFEKRFFTDKIKPFTYNFFTTEFDRNKLGNDIFRMIHKKEFHLKCSLSTIKDKIYEFENIID